jgi:hypothetical protein
VVTCSSSLTLNVIVYTLDGVFTPDDNFTGRSLSRFGLAEVVYLSFTADPPITAAQAGGLKWKLLYGDGTLVGGTDGTGTFTAGATPGPATLKLRIESGPSAALGPWYSEDVIAPSGGYIIQKSGTGIWHVRGFASVGFLGWSYLLPKDVSFKNIETREGECAGVGTGRLSSKNGEVHSAGGWNAVGTGNIEKGCRELYEGDEVQTGEYASPFGTGGTFTWQIPVEYRVGSGTATQFGEYVHGEVVDSDGTAHIGKAGAGPFQKALNDPDSNW